MLKKERIKEVDFIRAIVALFVIGIHASAGYVATDPIAQLWNSLMACAVPVFIMLSGFGLMSSENDKKINYLRFQKKRLPKLIVPYLFWSLFYFFVYKSYYKTDENFTHTIHRLFNGLFYGNTIYHLYFLVILLLLYLLFPLLKVSVTKYPLTSFIVSVIAFGLSTYFANALYSKFNIYGFYQPLNWLIYFTLGMYVSINFQKIKLYIYRKEVFVTLLWLFTFFLFFQQSNIHAISHLNGAYIKAIYSIMSFYFFLGLGIQLYEMKREFNIISFISKHSFLMYLIHPFFLFLFSVVFDHHPKILTYFQSTTGMVISYIIVLSLSILFSVLISIVPFNSRIGSSSSSFKYIFSKKNDTLES